MKSLSEIKARLDGLKGHKQWCSFESTDGPDGDYCDCGGLSKYRTDVERLMKAVEVLEEALEKTSLKLPRWGNATDLATLFKEDILYKSKVSRKALAEAEAILEGK